MWFRMLCGECGQTGHSMRECKERYCRKRQFETHTGMDSDCEMETESQAKRPKPRGRSKTPDRPEVEGENSHVDMPNLVPFVPTSGVITHHLGGITIPSTRAMVRRCDGYSTAACSPPVIPVRAECDNCYGTRYTLGKLQYGNCHFCGVKKRRIRQVLIPRELHSGPFVKVGLREINGARHSLKNLTLKEQNRALQKSNFGPIHKYSQRNDRFRAWTLNEGRLILDDTVYTQKRLDDERRLKSYPHISDQMIIKHITNNILMGSTSVQRLRMMEWINGRSEMLPTIAELEDTTAEKKTIEDTFLDFVF